ncbi:hypothetical protein [Herbaspirillum lusitanum]|uniref:hypothetical protein n=1 Tax=Herbaspirillum lusitanum TaxID=213312 RepID=UPI002238D7D8|nr:hypothetical protein [Herbaspirillum lusitanum]
MEDAVTFDVYAKAFAPHAEFSALVVTANVYGSELKARAAANEAKQLGGQVLIGKHIGWAQARAIVAKVAGRSATEIMQAGYFPSETSQYCSEHDLHYGGCLGCHVCNNFFVP